MADRYESALTKMTASKPMSSDEYLASSGSRAWENYLRPELDRNITKRGDILPIGKNKQGGVEFAIPQGLIDVYESLTNISKASNPETYRGDVMQGEGGETYIIRPNGTVEPFQGYTDPFDITKDAFDVGLLGGATSFATKGVPKGALSSGFSKQAAKSTDRTEAFNIAQKNAAKPKSEGGLGLPANNTAADRAKAMGFDVDAYHGAKKEIRSFDPKEGVKSDVSWFSGNPKIAETYVQKAGPEKPSGNVIPVKIKTDDFAEYDAQGQNWNDIIDWENYNSDRNILWGPESDFQVEEYLDVSDGLTTDDLTRIAIQEKLGGVSVSDVVDRGPNDWTYSDIDQYAKLREPVENYAVIDPKNVRSRFAAFDPARADSADILAANPLTMAIMKLLEQAQDNE